MDKKDFLDAIAQDKYNESLHFQFSDWLSENGFDDEAEEQRTWTPERQEAEDWLREFADDLSLDYGDKVIGWSNSSGTLRDISYESLLQIARDYLNSGDYFIQSGGMSLQESLYSIEVKEKFWKSIELVTGLSVEDKGYHNPFSCSC